ncbi:MAG: minor capsid protein [Treponema sp.]|uniref:minor capsid protein n=1 Tax=Treponema sp. TaxID=166 RepID=UPI003FA2E1C7
MTITFSVKRLDQDGKIIKAKVVQRLESVQGYLDNLIIRDSNYFCPKETSVLQKSAIINTTMGSGLLIWQTPYARKQYYGEQLDHSKQRNPNACARWFEAAKARWYEKWVKFVNARLRNSETH